MNDKIQVIFLGPVQLIYSASAHFFALSLPSSSSSSEYNRVVFGIYPHTGLLLLVFKRDDYTYEPTITVFRITRKSVINHLRAVLSLACIVIAEM